VRRDRLVGAKFLRLLEAGASETPVNRRQTTWISYGPSSAAKERLRPPTHREAMLKLSTFRKASRAASAVMFKITPWPWASSAAPRNAPNSCVATRPATGSMIHRQASGTPLDVINGDGVEGGVDSASPYRQSLRAVPDGWLIKGIEPIAISAAPPARAIS
jgi:hypothetical protein